MWLKKKKINLLEKGIEKLSDMLQEGNFVEWSYLLGNKKEIIKRNLLAGIARGVGIRNRSYYNNSNTCHVATKNCDFEYSCDWRIYCRYCRNSGKK